MPTKTIKHTKINKGYNSKRNSKVKSYVSTWPYLPLNIVNQLEKIAEYYNISHKARGLQKPTKSDEGFLTIYRKHKGITSEFENLPVRANNPDGEKWKHHREDFCNRRYSMIKSKKNYGLYDSNGLPTVMHTNMLMWACSPDAKNIVKNVSKIIKSIKNISK